jgi:cyclic pyranopterin phosphate synthase
MTEPEKNIAMVDISAKPPMKRTATAAGKIFLLPSTIKTIKEGKIKKGNPLLVGELAALIAVKQTPLFIPLCHQIPINDVQFKHEIKDNYIEVFVIVNAIAQTGVEMEALIGVSIFLNNIWDMTKYLEKDSNGQYPTTKITDIRVITKQKTEI